MRLGTLAFIVSLALHLIVFGSFVAGGGTGDEDGANGSGHFEQDTVKIVPKPEEKKEPQVVTPIQGENIIPFEEKFLEEAKKCVPFFGGIGVQIGYNNIVGGVQIQKVYKGYPAYNSGVKEGDFLMIPWTDIRGEPGTILNLKLRRDGKTIVIKVPRDRICYKHGD